MLDVWIAYHSDWSDCAVFVGDDAELEALRYAVANSMQVAKVMPGQSLREQTR